MEHERYALSLSRCVTVSESAWTRTSSHPTRRIRSPSAALARRTREAGPTRSVFQQRGPLGHLLLPACAPRRHRVKILSAAATGRRARLLRCGAHWRQDGKGPAACSQRAAAGAAAPLGHGRSGPESTICGDRSPGSAMPATYGFWNARDSTTRNMRGQLPQRRGRIRVQAPLPSSRPELVRAALRRRLCPPAARGCQT